MRNNTPLTPAQKAMAEEYWPNARRIALFFSRKKRKTHESLEDDLLELAAIAVINAVRKYDPTKGKSPRTWINTNVWTRLTSFLFRHGRLKGYGNKKKTPQPKVISIYTHNEELENENQSFLVDRSQDNLNRETHIIEDIEDIIRKLRPSHQEIVRLIWVDGLTQVMVSERLGVSKQYISSVVAQSKKFTKKLLIANGIVEFDINGNLLINK